MQEVLQHAPQDRYAFSNPAERSKHIRLFFAWLPPVLRDAPGIEWDQLPSQVMGHLVRSVADHPDAIPIALAVGCAAHAMKRNTLVHVSSMLLTVCRSLRAHYGMTQISQLQGREVWMRFVTGRQLSAGEVRLLTSYASVAGGHLRTYLEHLDERHRLVLEPYTFPPLPVRFLERHAQHRATVIAAQTRRKEQSDVLTPLLPLLLEVAQFRKQAMERLYTTFCGFRDQAQAGALSLPHAFQYVDRAFSITEDAPTIAAVSLVERTVTLNLTLWNRDAWVVAHPELYGRCTRLPKEATTVRLCARRGNLLSSVRRFPFRFTVVRRYPDELATVACFFLLKWRARRTDKTVADFAARAAGPAKTQQCLVSSCHVYWSSVV